MNDNKEFKYLDQNKLFSKEKEHILSILRSQDGFVFYIHNDEENRLLHFEKHVLPPSNLLKFFLNSLQKLVHELKSNYSLKEIRLVLPSTKTTIVPSAIFDPAKLKELYALHFERSDIHSISYKKNQQFNSVLLYPVVNTIRNIFRDSAIPVNYYNQLSPFFEFIALQPPETGFELFVNVMSGSFDLLVVKDQALYFLNSFHYQSNTDFLYYILNVMKQLGIDKKEASINLIGVTAKNDEKLRMLPNFIERVYFYKELKLQYNFTIDQEHIIRYLNFLNLHLCAS